MCHIGHLRTMELLQTTLICANLVNPHDFIDIHTIFTICYHIIVVDIQIKKQSYKFW